MVRLSKSKPRPNRPDSDCPDEREYNIGAANRDNVSRLLSSLAIYPFTELLGYVSQALWRNVERNIDSEMAA
jgi:hypothetical protein